MLFKCISSSNSNSPSAILLHTFWGKNGFFIPKLWSKCRTEPGFVTNTSTFTAWHCMRLSPSPGHLRASDGVRYSSCAVDGFIWWRWDCTSSAVELRIPTHGFTWLAPTAINEIDSWRLFVVRSGIVLLVNTWLMIGSREKGAFLNSQAVSSDKSRYQPAAKVIACSFVKFETGRNLPLVLKIVTCMRMLCTRKHKSLLLQHVPGCSIFSTVQWIWPDYGLLLELHALTQVARSYAFLVVDHSTPLYCLLSSVTSPKWPHRITKR